MRITSIRLSGFRGFAAEKQIDLDADAVIIIGANGQGKTSLFDAVLWALTGNIPRLRDDTGIVSMYSLTGEARVTLEVQSSKNETFRIQRSFDGKNQKLLFEHNGEKTREPLSNHMLLNTLWPDALKTDNSAEVLTTAITRSIYLQQDLVRQFVEADDDQDRFKAIGELVGVGRVTELQSDLERAKASWNRATNLLTEDQNELTNRKRSIEDKLAKLGQTTSDFETGVVSIWNQWWDKVKHLGVSVDKVPTASSVEAASAIDTTVKGITAMGRSLHRRLDNIDELIDEMESRHKIEIMDETVLEKQLQKVETCLVETRKALADTEEHAADVRRILLEKREANEDLRTLAKLALRQLGDHCPVCGQIHDIVATQKRLEEIIVVEVDDKLELSATIRIGELATEVEEQARQKLAVEMELLQTRETVKKHRLWESEQEHRFKEVGIDPKSGLNELKIQRDQLATKIEELKEHVEKGEELALRLATAAELARRTELEKEHIEVAKEVEILDRIILNRNQTAELAGNILYGLRDASYFVVTNELKQIEPILQRIYSIIDPHPAFRVARFMSKMARGRGHLTTELDDKLADKSATSPSTVLSSSQLNALAVSIFLALNLSIPTLPLKSALLDDPLQSLDDVNLLGIIDLLRRTKDRRQLIISTHDNRFGRLLERKLRPVQENQRTIVVEFGGWSREGPCVDQYDVERDLQPLRIVT